MRSADRGKFVSLAEKRVQRTIKDVRLIGNLSNRSNYVYTEDDVRKIYRALQKELNDMKARFDRRGEASDVEFRLE